MLIADAVDRVTVAPRNIEREEGDEPKLDRLRDIRDVIARAVHDPSADRRQQAMSPSRMSQRNR